MAKLRLVVQMLIDGDHPPARLNDHPLRGTWKGWCDLDIETVRAGAVRLIQRFGSALNLNIHFHILFLDGVYAVDSPHGTRPRFRWVRAPTSAQLAQLAHTIARRSRKSSYSLPRAATSVTR